MKIKSFGCSFIFGSDLSDNPDHLILDAHPIGQFSHLTWPALLAKKLQYTYDCHARPGSGNLQIAERVLNECACNDDSFFIICWTYIDRFDYIKSNLQWQSDGTITPENCHYWQPWNTITPGDQDHCAKMYYQNLHSEYKDKLSTLIYVKTVIDSLLQNNVKFMMTFMDNLMFDQTWHTSNSVKNLQKYIKPYMTTFEGETFLDWSRRYKFPESDSQHPLEKAHQAAADHIIKVFDKQNINVPTQQVHV